MVITMKHKNFICSKNQKSQQKLVHCTTTVPSANIRRESINGDEHIVITSFTLPGNIVMNGIMYPQEERDKSYKLLNRTLAPVEHPTDIDGNFVSAYDPTSIHNFHAGAYNDDAEIDGSNRIKINKYVNVKEAKKTEKGKRLLDRIEELETNENGRPIHTSVGLWLDLEELDTPQTNEMGQEYSFIASNFVFDHDAILLDSVGAAQPHQGTGIGINSSNLIDVINCTLDTQTIKNDKKTYELANNNQKWVETLAVARWKEFTGSQRKPSEEYKNGFFYHNADSVDSFNSYKLPFVDVIDGAVRVVPRAIKNALLECNTLNIPKKEKDKIKKNIISHLPAKSHIEINESGLKELNEKLYGKLRTIFDFENTCAWIEEIWIDRFVYEVESNYFMQYYTTTETGGIEFINEPKQVSKQIEYEPVNEEQDEMKEKMIEALKKAGISVNSEMTDDELLALFSKLKNNSDDTDGTDGTDDSIDPVLAAVNKMSERLNDIELKLTANETANKKEKISAILSANTFPQMTEEDLLKTPDNVLDGMYNNCQSVSSFGIPLGQPLTNSGSDPWADYGLPE